MKHYGQKLEMWWVGTGWGVFIGDWKVAENKDWKTAHDFLERIQFSDTIH